MRIIVASCSATYSGRGDTRLNRKTRAIVIKNDGSASIHNEVGNKPLNYMGKGTTTTEFTDAEGNQVLVIESRKENLTITLHEVVSDVTFGLDDDDDGLVRDGTEDHLQAWLSRHPEVLMEGCEVVQREFPTGAGPVDLLAVDTEGTPWAVEVKRVAMTSAVYQVIRYVEAMKQMPGYEDTKGMIVALDIRPKTMELAAKKSIPCVVVPPTWRDFKSQEPVTESLALEVVETTPDS